jgi:putative addiction module component (TIGR02574 family)
MSKTLDALFALAAEERIRLAQALWDSVAADPDYRSRLSEHERAEIDRRLAAHTADPVGAVTAEELLEEMERRYG